MEGGHIFDFPESRITCLFFDFKSLDESENWSSILRDQWLHLRFEDLDMRNEVHVPDLRRVGDVDANNKVHSHFLQLLVPDLYMKNKVHVPDLSRVGDVDAKNEPHGPFL